MANEHTEPSPPATPSTEEEPKQEEEEEEITPLHELLSHSIVDIYVGSNASYPLHEKLLCHHSAVLRRHFYAKDSKNSSYGLPDDTPEVFGLLVGWLYSNTLPFPPAEDAIGPLLDLYMLAEKLEMAGLASEVVETTRTYYQHNECYPSLRRVQYVYENTEDDNPMREMMVSSIARYLTLGEKIPKHWDGALRRNGQLAVDIIRAIQEWHLEGRSIPDAREHGMGFSSILDTESVRTRENSVMP